MLGSNHKNKAERRNLVKESSLFLSLTAKTMRKKKTPLQKAVYIVGMVKESKKDLDYAIDIIPWYSATDKEDKQIEKIIREIW